MRAHRLSREILLLAGVNFLYCFAVYATLPVLALYFHTDLRIPVTQVGLLLGLPPLIGAIFGSLGAPLASKIGKPRCLIVGSGLMLGIYGGYLLAGNYLLLLLLSGLAGLARVFWNPIIKALFAQHAQRLETPKVAFQINYLTICLGALLGPLVAMIPHLPKRGHLLVSSSLFALIGLLLYLSRHLLMRGEAPTDASAAPARGSLRDLDRAARGAVADAERWRGHPFSIRDHVARQSVEDADDAALGPCRLLWRRPD